MYIQLMCYIITTQTSDQVYISSCISIHLPLIPQWGKGLKPTDTSPLYLSHAAPTMSYPYYLSVTNSFHVFSGVSLFILLYCGSRERTLQLYYQKICASVSLVFLFITVLFQNIWYINAPCVSEYTPVHIQADYGTLGKLKSTKLFLRYKNK